MGRRMQFSDSTPLPATPTDVDKILSELITHVKTFKCPSGLDFPTTAEHGLILLNNERNRPFIDQLRKFDRLRTRLSRVQTHGDEELEAKCGAIDAAIERALFRMKEHQLKLYDRYREALVDQPHGGF